MRPLPAAFAISAALHVVAYAWALDRKRDKPVAVPPPALAPKAMRAAEPPPVAVVLLDGDSVRPPASGQGPRPRGRSQIRNLRAEVRGPTSEVPAPVPPPSSPLMRMREPDLRSGAPQGFIDHFLAHDAPGVDPDRLDNPKWVENASPDAVEAAREERIARNDARDGEELAPAGGGSYESKHETFHARVAPDGSAHLNDTPDVDVHLKCLFAGCKMGLDDWAMRQAGIDPYRSAKLQWLDKTRDERAEIGRRYRKDQLAHAPELVQENLAWMWQRTRDPDARKRALFEMWDEIAETGDADLVRAGAAARAYLVGFIRTRLPRGTPGAFSDRELAELNAHRHSRAVFAPYD